MRSKVKLMKEVDLLFIACVHNRKKKTLAALKSIFEQNICSKFSIQIVILDDGSIDQTALAVKKFFPKVDLLTGDGSYFWAGGMRYLFSYIQKRYNFRYLVVFNDDIVLEENALISLINTSTKLRKKNIFPHVVTGTFLDLSKESVTYGGVNSYGSMFKKFRKTNIKRIAEKVDTLNMNLALIPL